MNEDPSTGSESSATPFWGSMTIPEGGPFFFEIFAGEAGLSKAVNALGTPILPPIEIEIKGLVNQSVDLFDPAVLAHIHLLIEHKKIKAIHFGIPCSSFSLARKDDGGPPPLRDMDHLRGKSGLAAMIRQRWSSATCVQTPPRSWFRHATATGSYGRSRILMDHTCGSWRSYKSWLSYRQ